MRRGAQYKVLSTIYNILRRVSLIRHARQGHDFPTTTTPDGDDHVISRATALHTAAEAPHAPHTHARSFASTHESRRLPSMLDRAISQTVHSKLDHMAPRATRPRRQHVEVAAQRHDDDFPSQRGLEGARQPSPQRRSARCVGSARSARQHLELPHACGEGARAHDEAMVKSERDDWGGEVRRAGTAYRAQTFLRAESARVARCSSRRRLVRRFAMSVTRRYLPRSSASRDSSRTLTGTWRRRVAKSPSRRREHTVSEAAGKGTRAWTAGGHLEGPK